MTLGEVKLEALRLIDGSRVLELGDDQLVDALGDETLGYYLSRMVGAINRALGAIERAGVLPCRRYVITREVCEATLREDVLRFDARAVIPDYGEAVRLVVEHGDGYDGAAEYRREQDVLLLADFDDTARYALLYRPRLTRVHAGTDDQTEMEGPDEPLCALIPYFIKGDLFRGDDPDEADAAMMVFRTGLAEARRSESGVQRAVRTVYGEELTV